MKSNFEKPELTRSHGTWGKAIHQIIWMLFLCISPLCVKPTHQVSHLLFLSNIAVTWLRFMLLRISQGESVGPSSSFLFTLLTFRENSKLPEYQIVCLFAFPCHLLISAGIILYCCLISGPHTPAAAFRFLVLTSTQVCPLFTCRGVRP